jgi:very-short-patch-repair endonuclease
VHVNQSNSIDGQEDSVAAEVERVVQLVLEHASERPNETLGVITMGIKHANRIDMALYQALQTRTELQGFFDQSVRERFFVKNLERVQGDERDAIILSIGYGKDHTGRLLYRFGPLLAKGGERRLNVAVTRARVRLTLVSSFSHFDMEPGRTKARGVELLRAYLEYASSGGTRVEGAPTSVPLNAFEQDVFDTLSSRGMPLSPQWGASRYRIDLAARHRDEPGRFVLAIECDGASYHAAPTARDRDRLRQEHLEALGWRFHRIWSTDWYLRKPDEVDRALAAYEAAMSHAKSIPVAPPRITKPPDMPLPNGPANTGEPFLVNRGFPPVAKKGNIREYSRHEIDLVINWVLSDGRLRTDEELVDEARVALGFERRGKRIEKVIREAIERTRRS